MDKYSIDTDREQFVSMEDEYQKLTFIKEKCAKAVKTKQELFAMELKNGLGQQIKETLADPHSHELKVVVPKKYLWNRFCQNIKRVLIKITNIFN